MNRKQETHNILVNIDALFDVKLSILKTILPEETHNELLEFWGSESSIFDYVNSWGDYQDEFITRYDNRTIDDLKKADLTSICDLIEVYNSIDSSNNELGKREYTLLINVFPYKFTDEEISSLIKNISQAIPSVTVNQQPISISLADLTPSRLREFNINELWMVDPDQWIYDKMKNHIDDGAILCPNIKMITPFIIDYRYKEVDTSRPEKILNDRELDIKAKRIDLFAPLIEVEYITANYFRSMKAVKVYELNNA